MIKNNKKIAILQSNYIPWKGYFDIIRMVDEFVIFDEAQYTKNDWRNRNKIKTSKGMQWLTIPVNHTGKLQQTIKEAEISKNNWSRKHWNAITLNYKRAQYFNDYKELFEELYTSVEDEKYLCKVNYKFIFAINEILDIDTKITWSDSFEILDDKTERLVHICKLAGANEYVSGPGAKNYLDQRQFEKENIKITWMDYSDYREYNQLYPPFEHAVSIIDLIFNEGPNAIKYMKTSGD